MFTEIGIKIKGIKVMSQQFSILGTSTVNQRGKRLHCLAVMQ